MSSFWSSSMFGQPPQHTRAGAPAANPFMILRPHQDTLPPQQQPVRTTHRPIAVRRLAVCLSSPQHPSAPPPHRPSTLPPATTTSRHPDCTPTLQHRQLPSLSDSPQPAATTTSPSSPGTLPRRATAFRQLEKSALCVLDGAPASKSGSSTPTTTSGQRADFPTQATYFLRACSTSVANPNATQQQIATGYLGSTSKDSSHSHFQPPDPTCNPH